MSDKRSLENEFLEIMRDHLDKMEYDTSMNLLFHHGRVYAANTVSAQVKGSHNKKILSILQDTLLNYSKIHNDLSISILDPNSIVFDRRCMPEEERDQERDEDQTNAFLSGIIKECEFLIDLFSQEESGEEENPPSFFKISTKDGREFVGTIPQDLVEIFQDSEDVEEAFTVFLKSFNAKT